MKLIYKQNLSETSEDVDILLFLSKHKKSNLRKGVAKNKNTPRSILLDLIKDPNIEVVKQVAVRVDLTHDMFQYLIDLKNHDIEVSLASNSELPEEFQLYLMKQTNFVSYDFHIAKCAKSERVIQDVILNPHSFHRAHTLCHLIRNPNFNESHLIQLFDQIKDINIYNTRSVAMEIANHKCIKNYMIKHFSKRYPDDKKYFYDKVGLGNFI